MAASYISTSSATKSGFSTTGPEGGIALDLVDHGVPKHDIALGFHSPFKRQFTEYVAG
ncbi:MAG: element excision factor XisI family protein [Elainellaceae cyanobacterium]